MLRRRVGRRFDGTAQEGFTLIELVVGIAMSLIVLGALAMLLGSLLRSQPANEIRAAQIQEARVALERTVRELRQSKAVAGVSASATQITVDAYTRAGCNGAGPTAKAVLCRVTYTCAQAGSTASCTRRAGTAPPTTAISGLASPNVFSYGSTTTPSCALTTVAVPTLVCLKLTYPARDGAETVTIEDSAYLRNPSA